MSRPFRFGVVAAPQDTPEQWQATARRVEELGYDTLLMPDGLQLLAPFPTLAVAAMVTTRLRVGTYVLASPLRPARTTAWEAHSLSVLTGGRFELGMGSGRPEVRKFVQQLGLPFGAATERLQRIEDAVAALRELDGDQHTPVLVAAGGPKALAMAARIADTVMLACPPLSDAAAFQEVATQVRSLAGSRAEQIELGMNIFVVGDTVPPWVQGFIGVGAEELIAHRALTMLRGDVDEMVEELQRRRDEIGISYVSVHGNFLEQLAPVVERLSGT